MAARSILPVYNLLTPIVDKEGKLIAPWNMFFQQLVQPAPAVASVTLTGSPFDFTPNTNGNAIVYGGTVSNISIIRGTDVITVASSTTNPVIVPLAINDTLRVTYSVLPAIKFLGS